MDQNKEIISETIETETQSKARQYEADYQSAKEIGANVKLLFLAFLAAAIGAAAGSLPLLINIFMSGKTSPFLFIFIPLSIVFFMVTFKSYRGKFALVLTLLLSVVAVFVVNCILFRNTADYTSIWDAFFSESLYSYIFILIGSLIGFECLMNDKINPPRA